MIRTSLLATVVALLACGIGLAQEVKHNFMDDPHPNQIVNAQTKQATGPTSQFSIQRQTACEIEMLDQIGAREVFSGKAYEVLTEVASAYDREIPHIYIYPGTWNMSYIAASTAVDGRGKIVVGQQALESFNTTALRGFLGHEMAHLFSDNAAHGCNDYIIRDPQMEADADALAAQVLGMHPVKVFLERAHALALTQGLNSDAKSRLEVLQASSNDSDFKTSVPSS
jgi:Zn-dependent protease with chaperone function